MSSEQTIKLNGNEYTSIKKACEDNGISLTSIYEYRRKNHCNTEEALIAVYNKKQIPSEKIKAFGEEFDSIAQACRKFNVSGDTVRSCMRDLNMSIEEAINETRKRMKFTEKCIQNGINPYTARNFIRFSKCTQEEAIQSLKLAAKSSN